MKIEFEFKNKKLKRKNSEEKIDLPKDKQEPIRLEFKLPKKPVEKVYALIETSTNLYRFLINDGEDDICFCELPNHIFQKSTFFKVRLHTVKENKKRLTNTVIVPLTKHHHKHKQHKNCAKKQYNYHKYDCYDCDDENKEHHHHNEEECDEKCEYYPDVFQYILDELKESITRITVDKRMAYAYHDDDKGSTLVQIIPLPQWVTRDELNDFMSEILTEIELDSMTGDIYEVKGELTFSEDQ